MRAEHELCMGDTKVPYGYAPFHPIFSNYSIYLEGNCSASAKSLFRRTLSDTFSVSSYFQHSTVSDASDTAQLLPASILELRVIFERHTL